MLLLTGARILAISAYISFFINTLSIITWKTDENELKNETSITQLSTTISTLMVDSNTTLGWPTSTKMDSLWLFWDLSLRVLITIFWLFFLNKTGKEINRWKFWKTQLQLFSTLVFVNLFTFFPVSDAQVIRSSKLTEEEKKKLLSMANNFRGARFYAFFLIFYVVLYK